ncbi:MAG: hypothetical protein Q7Q73_02560 [Verrucomicrobiota bacterium JB024]|nr:hypothetical protein [Verrucomicrobiota bacterium JB024]
MNALSEREELFYRKLFSIADDYGLFDARAPILRTRMYPLRPTVRETDMTHLLAACEKAGLVALYEHAGKPYGVILDFGQQRKSKPKHPLPPAEGLGIAEKKEGAYVSFSKSVTSRYEPLPSVTSSNEPLLNSKCEITNADAETAPERGSAPPLQLYDEFRRAWNALPGVTTCKYLSDVRMRELQERLTSPWWAENWKAAMAEVGKSEFCRGDNRNGWRADIGWFLKPDTALELVEGKYANAPKTGSIVAAPVKEPTYWREALKLIAKGESEEHRHVAAREDIDALLGSPWPGWAVAPYSGSLGSVMKDVMRHEGWPLN